MDNLLKATKRYLKAEAAVNAYQGGIEGSAVEVEFQAAIEAIKAGDLVATTHEGAMAALRLAQNEHRKYDGGCMAGELVNGAMAYFDHIDTANGTAFASATAMVGDLDLSGVKDTMWMAVYDGLTLAAHGIEGIKQRPQCAGRDGPNAAGAYLEAIANFLFEERCRAMEILLARPLDMARNIECMVRLQWMAYDSNGEELSELKREVTQASDLRDLYVEQRYGRKEVRS